MKITINSKNLLNAVQKVGGCIKQNHTLPLYQNILLTTGKHTLEIMASNLEITALTEVPATIEGKVHTCINYQMFSSILKNMPNGGLVLEFTDKNVRMTLGDSDYELPLMDPTGFILETSNDYTNSFTINTQKLLSSLKRAEKFTGNDELRPIITVVNLHADGTSLMVVASDGHQFYHENIQENLLNFELLLHKAVIGFLANNPFSDNEIKVEFSNSKAIFKDGTTWVEITLVDAKYFQYMSIMPKGEGSTKLEVERAQILSKLNNLSPICANLDYKLLKMELQAKRTVLSCNNDFLNNKGKEVLPVGIQGNEITIGFNADIFKDMVSVIEDETLTIHFTQPNKPAWIAQKNITALALPYGLK